nr:hypothetical protein [Tanacetum cinerariifolium]
MRNPSPATQGSVDGVTTSLQLSLNSSLPMLDHQDKYMMKAQDDLEEIDLKWQLALLSMRARRWDILQGNAEVNQERRPRNQDNSRKTMNVEDTSSKATVAIDGAGFDWSYMADDEAPTNMALMAFS